MSLTADRLSWVLGPHALIASMACLNEQCHKSFRAVECDILFNDAKHLSKCLSKLSFKIWLTIIRPIVCVI